MNSLKPTFKLLTGEVLHTLKTLADKSVHCVITSPPYFGLRSYFPEGLKLKEDTPEDIIRLIENLKIGVFGFYYKDSIPVEYLDYFEPAELGLENTPTNYVNNLVLVFREIRRVLRDDGTVWLNLGSSYAGSGGGGGGNRKGNERGQHDALIGKRPKTSGVYKPKDLIPIPWLVGIALQEDGWWLRQDIIWAKGCSGVYSGGSVLTESVRDRFTKSHEYVLLLSKSKKYFFDQEAVKEGVKASSLARMRRGVSDNHKYIDGPPGQTRHTIGLPRENDPNREIPARAAKRNRRSVWVVHTKPFSGIKLMTDYTENEIAYTADAGCPIHGHLARYYGDEPVKLSECNCKPANTDHFATFPPKLVETCVLAGCPDRVCSVCGSPWIRNTEKGEFIPMRWKPGDDKTQRAQREMSGATEPSKTSSMVRGGVNIKITTGFTPSCSCDAEPIPGTVLDPFSGSGTTGEVSVINGRDYIGIDINPENKELATRRINKAIGSPVEIIKGLK